MEFIIKQFSLYRKENRIILEQIVLYTGFSINQFLFEKQER